MKCEWIELVEYVAYLLFIVIINPDSYSRMNQNEKTGLIFTDRRSTFYSTYILVYTCLYIHIQF